MNDLSAPAHTAPIDLDATDQSIINLLRKDGRMPYRAIARELDIALKTVEAHRARIMVKLGVTSLAGLVRLAVQHGLLGRRRQ